MIDNKTFWQTVKLILFDKAGSNSKITLIHNNTIISDDKEVAETMNDYFLSITDSFGLTENREVIKSTEGVSGPIDRAMIKYSKQPCTGKVKRFAQINDFFQLE